MLTIGIKLIRPEIHKSEMEICSTSQIILCDFLPRHDTPKTKYKMVYIILVNLGTNDI